MMIDPPIEELREKAGNEYILANVVAKRAKTLEKEMPDFIDASQEKAISLAARELYSGKIEARLPEDEKKENDSVTDND